jgi:hypothetical protein
LFAAVSYDAPCRLAVLVADAKTGSPISGARVQIDDYNISTRTDSLGESRFSNLPAGRVVVTATGLGYLPMEVSVLLTAADEEVAVFLMHRFAPILDTVRVKGYDAPSYLREFEERRRFGRGRYLTYPQLDSARGESIVDLVSRRFAGLRAIWNPSRTEVMLLSSHGSTTLDTTRPCRVEVYVDGQVHKGDEDLTLIRADEVAGVEYYSIAPPVQYYSAGFSCGALLIWLRKY